MTAIPTVRAAHIIGFVELLRDIGSPVERTLQQVGLPQTVERTPDAMLSDILAMSFIGASARREGIEDIGWLGVRQFQMSHLCAATKEGLAVYSTVLGRLQAFFTLAKAEDASLSGGVLYHGDKVWIWCAEPWLEELEPHYVSEWYVIGVLIEIIRSVTGPNWCPSDITFRSRFNLAHEAQANFPDTRFLMGQTHTAVSMPRAILAMTAGGKGPEPLSNTAPDPPLGFDAQIRSLVQPYLMGAVPSIQLAAEMTGTSVRTFQRRLQGAGMTYSQLVDQARFEAACDLLKNSDAKAREIAQQVGYTSASNFSRAFRRISGLSPQCFRAECEKK